MTFAVAANEKGEKVLTMSKEYIEREVVIEGIRKYYYKNPPNSSYQEGFDYGLDKAQRVILDAPVADVVEVRHGRWTIAEDDYYGLNIVKCSVCHEEWCFEERDDVFDLNYHYCPNCGAKMDKEE